MLDDHIARLSVLFLRDVGVQDLQERMLIMRIIATPPTRPPQSHGTIDLMMWRLRKMSRSSRMQVAVVGYRMCTLHSTLKSAEAAKGEDTNICIINESEVAFRANKMMFSGQRGQCKVECTN
jgi:hypothetical protein